MNADEAEKIIAAAKACITPTSPPRHISKAESREVSAPVKPGAPAVVEYDPKDGPPVMPDSSRESLYQYIKKRIIGEAQIDPTLVRLLMIQPEIEVLIERQVVQLEYGTLKGRTARLFATGWFTEPRSTSATRSELGKTGADPGGGGALNDVLVWLQKSGFLTKDSGGKWAAIAGVKVTEKYIATGEKP